MKVLSKTVKLLDGRSMPRVGLGTWICSPEEARSATSMAIDAGYRLIDTAFNYCNENGVGAAVKDKIESGIIKRDEIFVTTKLWNTHHAKADVIEGAEASCRNLGLDYVDLFLVHWPFQYVKRSGDAYRQFPLKGKEVEQVRVFLEETWQGMLEARKRGLTKSIGVSNFNLSQMKRIIEAFPSREDWPVVNQVECHPMLIQADMLAFCKSHDIILESYCPLASPGRPWADKTKDPNPMNSQVVTDMATKRGKSPGQIILRWHLQRDCVVIPKSGNPDRQKANLDIFDFDLSSEDMSALSSLMTSEYGQRVCAFNCLGNTKHPDYPFAEEGHVEGPFPDFATF